jgi:hypothetical protein
MLPRAGCSTVLGAALDGAVEALLRSVAFVAPWREATLGSAVPREVTEKRSSSHDATNSTKENQRISFETLPRRRCVVVPPVDRARAESPARLELLKA